MNSKPAFIHTFRGLGFSLRIKSSKGEWTAIESQEHLETFQGRKYFSVLRAQEIKSWSRGIVSEPAPMFHKKRTEKGIFSPDIFDKNPFDSESFPMGHIEFPCSIPHPILFLGSPSLISILLNMENDKALKIALGMESVNTIYDTSETGEYAIRKLAIDSDYRSIVDNAKRLEASADSTIHDTLVKHSNLILDLADQNYIAECLFLNYLPVLPAALRMVEKNPAGQIDFGEINDAYIEILQTNTKLGRLLTEGRAFQRQIVAEKYNLFKLIAKLFNLPVFKKCFENYYSTIPNLIDEKMFHDLPVATADKKVNVEGLIDLVERYEFLIDEMGETEVISLGKQRVGQNLFRQSLIDYWGCCAITGLRNEKLLRASHAKPWADCETVRERLDVFNGFLLSPQFDALFDAGLMTIDESGQVVFSENLTQSDFEILGLDVCSNMKINLDQRHFPYLSWHREKLFNKIQKS